MQSVEITAKEQSVPIFRGSTTNAFCIDFPAAEFSKIEQDI